MLQLTGCILVIIGCSGIAAVMCRDYNERLRILTAIRDVYEDLKYYISYQKLTVPEALLRLSEKEGAPFSETFYDIYEEVSGKNISLPDAWRKRVGQALALTALNEKEKKFLMDFPACLGYMEEDAQKGALDELQRQTICRIEELSGEQKNKNRMVMSLGIAGGILLSILLL